MWCLGIGLGESVAIAEELRQEEEESKSCIIEE